MIIVEKKCLRDWLIVAGILFVVISLTAMIVSIYLLIIIINMSTTTGENKILFFLIKG
jgi:hypothetical protein